MLHVIFYDNKRDFYNLDFLESSSDKEIVVVCPNPTYADISRSKLIDNNSGKKIDVITMSKFISDGLKEFDDIEVIRKADLFVKLATIWKKVFGSDCYETFFLSFNTFTELRGYTTDFNLISEILHHYDEKVVKGITYFWKIVEELKLNDEHEAYSILTDYLRNKEEENSHEYISDKTFIFYGFSHLSSGQIDMLQSLAIRREVYVPFSKSVFNHSYYTDWIRWIQPKENNDLIEKETIERINVVEFSKGRMGESIKKYCQSNQNIEVDIVLGTKGPSFDEMNEVTMGDLYFKSPNNMFLGIMQVLKKEILQLILKNSNNSVDHREIIGLIDSIIKEIISDEIKDFKKLKVLSLLKLEILSSVELSVDNENMELFDLKVIEYVTELKLPRVFSAPILSEIKGNIIGLESIESLPEDRQSLLCISSFYNSLKGGDNVLDEEVLSFLSSVGPIRRKELEFHLIKDDILELFKKEKFVLFIEKGIEDHDLGVNELLRPIENKQIINLDKTKKKQPGDLLENHIKKSSTEIKMFSPTRLQEFIDCPRKYYFSYIERISSRPELETNLRADELGQLEHKIIEDYFGLHDNYDEVQILALSNEILNKYIVKKKLKLTTAIYKTISNELYHYSTNGIKYLKLLQEIFDVKKILFEKKIDDNLFGGRIDVILETTKGIIILDFKRSKGSIPSKKDIDEFNKIQIPYYLSHSKYEVNSILAWGYINLSEIEKSLIFCIDQDLSIKTKESLFFNFYKNELDLFLKDYSSMESDVVKSIAMESNYFADPRKDDVCNFCNVKNICPRNNRVENEIS